MSWLIPGKKSKKNYQVGPNLWQLWILLLYHLKNRNFLRQRVLDFGNFLGFIDFKGNNMTLDNMTWHLAKAIEFPISFALEISVLPKVVGHFNDEAIIKLASKITRLCRGILQAALKAIRDIEEKGAILALGSLAMSIN